jgi:hypothetical protein
MIAHPLAVIRSRLSLEHGPGQRASTQASLDLTVAIRTEENALLDLRQERGKRRALV